MFKVKASFRIPVAREQLTKGIDREARLALRFAVRAWIRAMVTAIPVWEGTARGTIKPLGRFLNVAVPISPRASPHRTQHRIQGIIYQLGPEAGALYQEFNDLDAQVYPRYVFEFTEKLPYVIWNSFGQPLSQVKSAPWHAFEKAEEAFKAELDKQLRKRFNEFWQNLFIPKVINA